MNNKLWMIFAVSGGLIFSAQPKVLADLPTKIESNQQQFSSGQILPISAKAEIAGQTIYLEVAQTPEQEAMGLMYRTALADDRGMLFPVNPPESVSFWMKDVPINLDMIFLREGKVVAIAANVPPCPTLPCSFYSPAMETKQGITGIASGLSNEQGIVGPVTFNQSITPLENIQLLPVDQVIELRGGRTGELGLQAGDSLVVAAVPETSSYIGILAFGALGVGSLLKRN